MTRNDDEIECLQLAERLDDRIRELENEAGQMVLKIAGLESTIEEQSVAFANERIRELEGEVREDPDDKLTYRERLHIMTAHCHRLDDRIRELDELVLRHGRLWAKLDLALGDKRMAGDLTCADAAIKRIRELESERDLHFKNWRRMDAAAKGYLRKIDEIDDENKRLREAIEKHEVDVRSARVSWGPADERLWKVLEGES